jgi:hypothetical protein
MKLIEEITGVVWRWYKDYVRGIHDYIHVIYYKASSPQQEGALIIYKIPLHSHATFRKRDINHVQPRIEYIINFIRAHTENQTKG